MCAVCCLWLFGICCELVVGCWLSLFWGGCLLFVVSWLLCAGWCSSFAVGCLLFLFLISCLVFCVY